MTATLSPRKVRKVFDPSKLAMAVWTALVLIFLFTPIGFIVAHSFNKGNSLVIWNGLGTKWWGSLFDSSVTVRSLEKIVGISVFIYLIGWTIERAAHLRPRRIRSIAGPLGFIVAVIVVGLQTHWYFDLFVELNIAPAMRNSFTAAIGGTILAVIFGGLAGVGLARTKAWWSKAFMFMIILILVTPEVMDAVALNGWFVRLGGPFSHDTWRLNGGILRLWVGYSLYTSAVVTLIVRARLAGLDESLEEAAADLGATPTRAFFQITMPLISSALVAGGLLSFTLCLDNTIIASAVSTAGSSTFPVYVVSSVKGTVRPFVAVAAVVLFAITMAALGFVYSVLKRSGESTTQIAATMTGT